MYWGPLTPLPGRGWTGLPCRLAENGGSGRKLLSDADERVTPSGKGPILQVRKVAWKGVPNKGFAGTMNLKSLKESKGQHVQMPSKSQ